MSPRSPIPVSPSRTGPPSPPRTPVGPCRLSTDPGARLRPGEVRRREAQAQRPVSPCGAVSARQPRAHRRGQRGHFGHAHPGRGGDEHQAAADSWHSHPDAQTAYDAAVAAIADRPADAAVADSFTVDADGTVRVRVDRTASTLMLFRVHRLAHYAGADATGMARFAG